MAHSKSAQKRIRQNETHRLRNRRRKEAVKTAVRALNEAVDAGAADDAAGKLKAVYRKLDKTAAKGTIHKRTAARRKSRLARRVNRIAKAAQPG